MAEMTGMAMVALELMAVTKRSCRLFASRLSHYYM